MTKLFVVLATDKVSALHLRQEVRPAHREYLRKDNPYARVVVAGPTMDEATGNMNGTLMIVEAASLQDAKAFVQGDPYMQADIFKELEIRPWIAGLVKEFPL